MACASAPCSHKMRQNAARPEVILSAPICFGVASVMRYYGMSLKRYTMSGDASFATLKRPPFGGADVVDVRIADVVQMSDARDERSRPVAMHAWRELRQPQVMIVLRGWIALRLHHYGSINTCHQYIAL